MLNQMWDQIEPKVKQWVREYAPWATYGNVTSLSPLTVQPDGPGDPMLPSASLASGLRVGDRVYVLTFAGRAVVVGRVGGGGAVFVSPNSGFSPQSGYEPVVRREGGRVYMDGGWSSSGMAASGLYMVGVLPQWAWPGREHYFGAVSSNPASTSGARCVVYPDGNVQIRPSGTLGSFYLHDGVSWPVLD